MSKIFVISAPSGTGKTTIEKILKSKLKDVERIITYTTRKPRPGEKNGIDYFFVNKDEFKNMIKENKFIEWSIVYGNYYGTPKEQIEKAIKENKKILLIIDTQGGLKIKKKYPDAFLIGILPPSIKEQERRIRKRKGVLEEEIKKRLEISKEERKILFKEYNVRFINKNLENTANRIKKIINSF